MCVSYILDIVLLAVFLLFVAVGVRRGFIRSAIHFVGAAVSAFLASVLGGAAAQWVFDTLFRGALVEKIQESLSSLGTDNPAVVIQSVLSSLPDFLVRALEEAGVTVAALTRTISLQSGAAAEMIADSLSPVFVSFLKVLAVIVLFLLFTMLTRVLADLLSAAFHLPMLWQINGLLGGVFGFLLALMSVWVVISMVRVFTPMLAISAQQQLDDALNHSLIVGALVKWNPLQVMFQ